MEKEKTDWLESNLKMLLRGAQAEIMVGSASAGGAAVGIVSGAILRNPALLGLGLAALGGLPVLEVGRRGYNKIVLELKKINRN